MSEDSNVVRLEEKDVYGVRKYYPLNEIAKNFCLIAKTKTMTPEAIKVILNMGYEVVTDRVRFQE